MLLSIALYASGASEPHGGMDPGFETLFRWLAMGLTVPVLAWPGRSFFTGAVAALRGRRLTMDVPVALGLAVALLGSAFATVTGEGEIWFDSVVMFVALLGGARYLELVARRRSTATIRGLARSAPLVAIRVSRRPGDDRSDGTREERVPAAALRAGDRVRVRPGEVVPADGKVRSGESSFDESLLTGESTPVARAAGGRVLAGSVNGSGVVEIEVTSSGDDTVLGAVLRRAEEAARERPAVARLADRVAAWFIGGVLVLAASVAAAWLLHDPSRTVAVVVSVLVVTCPCALSLATPAAMTAALGALARAGLVATRANAIERLALATHCLADKTGTLTEGRFQLREVSTLGAVREARCLAIASALERYATHPAAAAFAGTAGDPEMTDGVGGTRSDAMRVRTTGGRPESGSARGGVAVEDARAETGGVAGRIDGVRHAIGSLGFVSRACRLPWGEPAVASDGSAATAAAAASATGTEGPPPEAPLRAPGDSDTGGDGDRIRDHEGGGTRVFLAREGAFLACFRLADSPRPGARDLVDGLRARGIETTIASGDSLAPVARTGEALGVARRLHGLTPADKLDEADRLAADGERVLMLGDGVNDAPALAGAHASVAMGRGAAAAASRADAVLLGTDPRALLDGIDIARRARRIVKQNLAWAVGYNLVALPLAAAGAVPPWAAAIGMSLSSLAVAGNALRLSPRRERNRRPWRDSRRSGGMLMPHSTPRSSRIPGGRKPAAVPPTVGPRGKLSAMDILLLLIGISIVVAVALRDCSSGRSTRGSSTISTPRRCGSSPTTTNRPLPADPPHARPESAGPVCVLSRVNPPRASWAPPTPVAIRRASGSRGAPPPETCAGAPNQRHPVKARSRHRSERSRRPRRAEGSRATSRSRTQSSRRS